jgi:hypothetical protein
MLRNVNVLVERSLIACSIEWRTRRDVHHFFAVSVLKNRGNAFPLEPREITSFSLELC